MDKKDAITNIYDRHYLRAAHFIVQGSLQDRIQPLSELKREQITRLVAILLDKKHTEVSSNDIGLNPKELAELVYNETVKELVSLK